MFFNITKLSTISIVVVTMFTTDLPSYSQVLTGPTGNQSAQSTTTKPDGTTIANLYKPTVANVFQESKTESWSPSTGSYNLSIGWVYI